MPVLRDIADTLGTWLLPSLCDYSSTDDKLSTLRNLRILEFELEIVKFITQGFYLYKV